MKMAPDTRNLMPGKATELVVAFLVECFVAAPLNCYGQSSFYLPDAYKRIDDSDEWLRKNLPRLYDLADTEYKKKHYTPKILGV